MTDVDDTKRVLEEWTAALLEELGLAGSAVDIDAILRLAGIAAHSVIRPAAPVTTYIVGNAAGLAAAEGNAGASAGSSASESAGARAETLARDFGDRRS